MLKRGFGEESSLKQPILIKFTVKTFKRLKEIKSQSLDLFYFYELFLYQLSAKF